MDAPRDQNNVTGKLACLNTDTVQGQHLIPIVSDSDGVIQATEVATISFTMVSIDPKDQNYVNCWLFQGSNGLVYPAVATSEGKLLVDAS